MEIKMLHDSSHGIVNLLRAIYRLKTYFLFYTLKNDFTLISARHKTWTYFKQVWDTSTVWGTFEINSKIQQNILIFFSLS